MSVGQPGTGDWAVGSDDRKYRHMTGYAFPVPSDYSLVNVRTGEAKTLLTASGFGVSLSPDGKYLLGFDNKDWFTISVPDGKKANLTSKLKEKFFDEEHDTPSAPPPYGGGQWTLDGKFVLVSDRFDIWKLAADGSSAENLTKIGRSQNIRFTILRPRSPEDRIQIDRHIDLSKPVLLGAENLATYDTGFYRLEPGNVKPGKAYLFDAEQHNPRVQLELFKEQPEMVEFLRTASHGQVMISMFRETFPKLPEGTVLLLDEPEMALSVSNQRRILKMLMELVDVKKFRIICATHSPVLIEAPETYVINLDKHINRNVTPGDQGVEGASTIQ